MANPASLILMKRVGKEKYHELYRAFGEAKGAYRTQSADAYGHATHLGPVSLRFGHTNRELRLYVREKSGETAITIDSSYSSFAPIEWQDAVLFVLGMLPPDERSKRGYIASLRGELCIHRTAFPKVFE